MAVITGTDELSLTILESLKTGTKVKDIPAIFGVSIDQGKRLSRYYNMLQQSNEHLSVTAIAKVQEIGLKALYLAPLFKDKDWEGLTEVLSAINQSTKRDELPVLIMALQEKRKRIQEFQKDIDNKLARLEQRERELQRLGDETKQLMEKVREETKFLSKYPQHVQDFFLKHLGIYGDQLVLSRRLDSRWQKSLKRKGILTYNNTEYVWFVNDLDLLVEEHESRINRKKPYPTEWDHDVEEKRSQNRWNVPVNPEYNLPTGLAANLLTSIKEIEAKKKEIDEERKEIQKEIKQLRKTSPKSFIEQVEASNTLSDHDLKRHGELQDKALKWLYNKGYIVASEVTLPNGKRADVIGYDEVGRIVIVEVKVTASDFLQDKKWESYLTFCDEFYFLISDEAQCAYYRPPYYQKGKHVGLLEETKNTLKIKEPHIQALKANEREKIQFLISRVLTKKYVYGYQ